MITCPTIAGLSTQVAETDTEAEAPLCLGFLGGVSHLLQGQQRRQPGRKLLILFAFLRAAAFRRRRNRRLPCLGLITAQVEPGAEVGQQIAGNALGILWCIRWHRHRQMGLIAHVTGRKSQNAERQKRAPKECHTLSG